MNEITCRDCGKYESECTCGYVVRTWTEQVDALQARIKELEALIPTPKEAMWLIDRLGVAKYFILNRPVVAKLQKIIEGDR